MATLLTKSDYKAACRCDRKLYYRKLGYANLKQEDPYLALLADGGYMVEKLARLLHPDGIDINTSGATRPLPSRPGNSWTRARM